MVNLHTQIRDLFSKKMTTSNLSNEFKAAQARLGTLQKDPGNDAKLKLYGLFKQVHIKHSKIFHKNCFYLIDLFQNERQRSVTATRRSQARSILLAKQNGTLGMT